MKDLKKWIASLLMVSMVLGMVACTNNVKPDPTTETQTAAQTEAQTAEQTPAQTEAQTDAQTDAQTEEETKSARLEEEIEIELYIQGLEGYIVETPLLTDARYLDLVVEDLAASLDSLSVVFEDGSYGAYLKTVNDVTAGKFGGYDGWMYRVNGVEPSVSMGNYEVQPKDIVEIYYGDPYGDNGFQFPEVVYEDGMLMVYSMDKVYDENYNESIVRNPVVDALVRVDWDVIEDRTDENGQIYTSDLLTPGEHTLYIEKYDDRGCPLVLGWHSFTLTIE